MTFKTATLSAIATVVALGVSPTTDAKAGPNAAIDACMKSFVATYFPERTVRQVATPIVNPSPLSLFSSREYTVLLSAHGASSGDLIAEARCVANRNGIVVVLESGAVAASRGKADFVVSMR